MFGFLFKSNKLQKYPLNLMIKILYKEKKHQ